MIYRSLEQEIIELFGKRGLKVTKLTFKGKIAKKVVGRWTIEASAEESL